MVRSREYATILMQKAAQDEYVVRTLAADPGAPDAAIGFHAQQAVEKALKAVLAAHHVAFRWRHDLVELLDVLRDSGIPFPHDLDDVRRLTPFATEFRYDDLPAEEEEPFDRAWALNCVERVRNWAEAIL
ncbi:MAG: HEPN domain-containing protein [Candidatus Brocadiae bacterium]|nr:HEPN domain-containing protein [Candidatus Brocadiia bacterium]